VFEHNRDTVSKQLRPLYGEGLCGLYS